MPARPLTLCGLSLSFVVNAPVYVDTILALVYTKQGSVKFSCTVLFLVKELDVLPQKGLQTKRAQTSS